VTLTEQQQAQNTLWHHGDRLLQELPAVGEAVRALQMHH
jgi:hypothetical protein